MNETRVVTCPHCEGRAKEDPRYAGMNVACPYCTKAFPMPTLATTRPPLPPIRRRPAPQRIDPSAPELETRCPTCGEWNTFPAESGGQLGVCCNCDHDIPIPTPRQAEYSERKRDQVQRWAGALGGILAASWFITRDLNVVLGILTIAVLILTAVTVFRSYEM